MNLRESGSTPAKWESNWSVSPNPADKVLTISKGDHSTFKGTIEVYSATGERLSSLQIPEETESAGLSLENYPQGIYFCKIIPVNGFTESIRFVIIHR